GDVLMDVATDKATVEYQSIDSGWLRKQLVNEGEDATVNQPIAIFTEEKDESIEGYAPPAPPKAKVEVAEEKPPAAEQPPPKVSKELMLQQPAFVPEPPLEQYAFEFPTEAAEKRILASPLAKKIAKEKGLDLSTVKGSGPHQRIMSRDLEKA